MPKSQEPGATVPKLIFEGKIKGAKVASEQHGGSPNLVDAPSLGPQF